jgi:hypothetical protein
MDPLTVYVPTVWSDLRYVLTPGCAIVGGRRPLSHTDLVVIDLEDNRYGNVRPADDMAVYLACVARAADRHRTRYPTVARRVVDPAHLVIVGHVDHEGVFRLDDVAALEAWRRSRPRPLP